MDGFLLLLLIGILLVVGLLFVFFVLQGGEESLFRAPKGSPTSAKKTGPSSGSRRRKFE